MTWNQMWSDPAETPAAPPAPAAPEPAPIQPATTRGLGLRKGIATALLAAGLLTIGGVAIVNAADPSTSPAPSATTDGSGSGGTTTPSQTAPNRARGGTRGRTGHDCPNTGGSGSNNGSSGSNGTTPTPSTAPSDSSGV